jgi:rare lipoprotein A (peptidoglycan hydrolase)
MTNLLINCKINMLKPKYMYDNCTIMVNIKNIKMNYLILIFALLLLSITGKAQLNINNIETFNEPVVLYEFEDFIKDVDDVTDMDLVFEDNKDVTISTAAGTMFGQASYYANKFTGRATASGELYFHNQFTAACNLLPLGTTIKVTNLSNNKSVLVKVNDRLSKKVNRIVDLSRIAATKLDYIQKGLTRVKVEVL